MASGISVVPMRDATQYVLSNILLARYWSRHDSDGLEFIYRALRGEYDSERQCDRCGKRVLGWQAVHELVLCNVCILEFIESKTTTVVIS